MVLPQVSIIGSGNLALVLSKNLEQCGIRVRELAGRTIEKVNKIVSQLYSVEPVFDFDLSNSQSKVFFLCVSDSAIAEVAYRLKLPPNALLVHCSGATALSSIEREDIDFGVFYPVQTFSGSRKLSLNGVPICIEANEDSCETMLEAIAKKMGAVPCFMSSEQRLVLHLSAVFACNFSNHLFIIAKRLLEEEDLPFELLEELIKETVKKSLEIGPENAQTGPAARRDYATMDKHLKLLENNPELSKLYASLSDRIAKGKA